MKDRRVLKETIGSVLLLAFLIFLTLNKNSKSSYEKSNYQFEAWADKGGYYIYLPWAINNNFQTSLFEKDVETKLGEGFKIEEGILKSKYSIGVALMQFPFYLIAHLNACLIYDDPSGFEKVYMMWMGVGSVFYLWLALICCYKLLYDKVGLYNSLASIVFILCGTNLFYYAIDETLMSHSYSFFLLSLLHFAFFRSNKFNSYRLIPILFLLLILRPTDMIYIPIVWIIFKDKMKWNFGKISYTDLIFILIGAFLLFIQFYYWWYAYGAFYPKGYGKEGFENILTPRIFKVLFEPNNGLIPYAYPLIIAIIFGSFLKAKNSEINKYYILTVSLVVYLVFLTGSWWTYTFGCGLGARNFVEFSFVWILLLGYILKESERRKMLYSILIGLNVIAVVINLQIIYHYDNCWFGKDNWDWSSYLQLIH